MRPQRVKPTEGKAGESPEPSIQTPLLMTLKPPPIQRPTSLRSTRSTGSGRYRHALLRSDVPGQHSIEKDLPIPAVLTTKSGDIMSSAKYNESALKSVMVPTRRSSLTNLMGQSYEMLAIGASPQATRVCINPLFHPSDTHAHVHHRGLVKGGDFCDAGLPVRDSPICSPQTFSSTSASSGNIMLGRVRRVLTDGDIHEEAVDVSQHIHRNHAASVKVRPALGLSYREERHDVRHGVSKVRPTQHLAGKEIIYERDILNFRPEQEPMPRPVLRSRKSSKAASYWGFPPISSDKKEEKVGLVENMDTGVSLRSRQSSDSKKSTSMAPNATIKLTEPHLTVSPRSYSPVSHRASVLLPSNPDQESGNREPTSIVSPVSYNEEQPSSNTPCPKKLQRRRTSGWLREILGFGNTQNTKLTSLPTKSYVRLETHNDHTERQPSITRTRTSTYSSDNTDGIEAICAAMVNLEKILSEALQIANESAAREGRRCIEESDLHSLSPDVSEAADQSLSPPSIYESIDSCSTDESQETPMIVNPTAFLGAVECGAHGCEALPLRALIRRSLAAPNMHSGNIIGPALPSRMSSLRHTHKSSYTVLKDQSILQKEYTELRHSSDCIPEECKSQAEYDDPAGNSKEVNAWSLDGGSSDDIIDFSTHYIGGEQRDNLSPNLGATSHSHAPYISAQSTGAFQRQDTGKRTHELRHVSLKNRSHVSLSDMTKFSLTKSVKRQPIARDWSPIRKRFVATIACISTALIGMLVGIYAGLVPSIQYYIADFHHYAIIGNVALYVGMALPTFFCWPLPLLHGRKPYIVCSLSVALPLLYPQAIAVSTARSPSTSAWRWALLLPRGLMGFALGFTSMNLHSILTDLFGASLMSSIPHQEVVDQFDVRRHGSGLGVWLSIWTWCWIGSLSVGFLIGAVVIESLPPSWGLYISIILIGLVLVMNVLCPEVRRALWRRSATEVKKGTTISRRLARGEVMMHRIKDGPRWWGQEVYHGIALSLEMLRQPGFVVMAVYTAWIYAQVVLIIVVSPVGLAFHGPLLMITAPRFTDFKILPLPIALCRCCRIFRGDWCISSSAIPEGKFPLQGEV